VTHGQFSELQHVLPTPDRDLHIRNLHLSQIPRYSIRAEITIRGASISVGRVFFGITVVRGAVPGDSCVGCAVR
jgi:hypothetical protein